LVALSFSRHGLSRDWICPCEPAQTCRMEYSPERDQRTLVKGRCHH
jgi:hypothetical protein